MNLSAWTDFLYSTRAAYAYDFTERVLIYAQCPDAIAVAPLDYWKRSGRRLKNGASVISAISDGGRFRLLCDVSQTYKPYLALKDASRRWELWDKERALHALNRAYGMREDNILDAVEKAAKMRSLKNCSPSLRRYGNFIALSVAYSSSCRLGLRSAAEDCLSRLLRLDLPGDLSKEDFTLIGRSFCDCSKGVLSPIAQEMRKHEEEGKWWVIDKNPYLSHGIRPLEERNAIEIGTPKMWGEMALAPKPGERYRGVVKVLDGDNAYVETEADLSGKRSIIVVHSPEGSAIRNAMLRDAHVEFRVGRSHDEIFIGTERENGVRR